MGPRRLERADSLWRLDPVPDLDPDLAPVPLEQAESQSPLRYQVCYTDRPDLSVCSSFLYVRDAQVVWCLFLARRAQTEAGFAQRHKPAWPDLD